MNPLNKPCVFVTSTGRTGTQFFGRYMSRVIEECYSIHEPDVIWIDRPSEWLGKLRAFGAWQMSVGRFSPRYSVRVLNNLRHHSRIDPELGIACLRSARQHYIEKSPNRIYLEANGQYSALLDLLTIAFPNSRVVYLIRDPRDWLRSMMNRRSRPTGGLTGAPGWAASRAGSRRGP
jgi:hypothetical protein